MSASGLTHALVDLEQDKLLICFSLNWAIKNGIGTAIPPAAVGVAHQLGGGGGRDAQTVVEVVFRGRAQVQFALLPHQLPSSFRGMQTPFFQGFF